MSVGNRGLGRGLDALLGGVKETEIIGVGSSQVKMISVEMIVPNPHQPRREFDADALEDLASSIRSQGVLQPILVRPLGRDTYELVAGERRLRASRLAGLKEIPSLVREFTDQESLAIALIENLQREDLNAIEEALGYQQLQTQFGLSQDELAKQVGKSRSALANSLRLLNLSNAIQQDIQHGELTAGHGRALMAVGEDQAREELHSRIKENGLTVRQAEAQASFWKQGGRLPGSGEEMVASSAKKDQKVAQSAEILELQNKLTELMGTRVVIKGSASQGNLIISYSSKEQLDELSQKLQ